MKKTLLMLLPLFVYAQTLPSLLESASKNNDHIIAKDLNSVAKKEELQSKKKLNLPTLDAGAFYQRSDKANPFNPGTIMSAYAKVAYDIYTGGKNESLIKQKESELSASMFEVEAMKKSVELQVVQSFFSIKTLEASLVAQKESSRAVAAQLKRVKGFLKASLATQDDVDRLQSAYDKNMYAIESLKFQILQAKKQLSLQVGEDVTTLDNASFKKVDEKPSELDSIKALRAKASSTQQAANQIDSFYMPQVRVEDTYSLFGYMDKPKFGGKEIALLDNQNKLMLSVNMRLYDFGMMSEAKESVLIQSRAVEQEINFQSKEQKMQQELALERIKTAKLQIKSAQSALKSATSALKTITEKYNSGIVDNVAYLDALSQETQAKSMHEASLNNLEIAYALYYYYNAKKLGDYL